MNQRRRWMLGSGILVIAIMITVLMWKPWVGKAEMLTREAAEIALLVQYPGVISSNVKMGDVYLMELQTDQGRYVIEVSAYSGEVVTLERLSGLTEEDDSPVNQGGVVEPTTTPTVTAKPTAPAATAKPDPSLTPVVTTTPSPSNVPSSSNGTGTKQLTSDKAGKLAAAHVKGEVENISLKTAKDGKKFYLVEIDVNDGREAVVQVNAISGTIMSVVWEKDDDDSDDNDE